LRYEDLPPEVLFHARRCMLDTLGVQVRGATLPWVQPVYRYVRSLGGAKEATVTFHGDRLIAPYAAYANSVFAYSCELQHHGSYGSAHSGVIVVPTVLALGEKLASTGRDIITAMAVGYEVQGRLGLELFDRVMKRHFHPQGLLGVFSSAAAAGKLLGLDEGQLAHAFAIAGSHASTIVEYDQAGGEVKRAHGAIALRNGIQLACLAGEGLTGPLTVFEGRRGVFAAFSGGEGDPERTLSDLGQPYCDPLPVPHLSHRRVSPRHLGHRQRPGHGALHRLSAGGRYQGGLARRVGVTRRHHHPASGRHQLSVQLGL
jgi:2-methylcitrate dehydratase PrpD